MKTLIIIPTYNERENIEALAEQITIVNTEFYTLVVDDNSPDGTGSVVQSLGAKNRRVRLLSRPSKQGLGGAYLAGFAYAMRHDFEHIVTMDADFSHDPSQLESLVKSSLQADVVIGSRYTAGGQIENWPRLRRWLSLTANRLARCAVGHEIGDWTSGYRCYRRHVIEQLPLESLRSNGYSFLVEVLAACLQLECRVTEVPITFCDRRSGRSKLSRVEIFKGMVTLLRLGLKRIFSSGVCQR
jgi:dolichol-phosphate mannosyltransferase